MDTLREALRAADTLTFDCYGTLIDWRAGIESTLLKVFGSSIMHCMHEVYERYVEAEKKIEAGGFRPYRAVTQAAVANVGEQLKVPVPVERADLVARSLGGWPAFADTIDALNRLKQRFRLGVLSNIDGDLFAQTAEHLGVTFDFVVTAEDVGSYKPDHGHFQRLFDRHADKENVIHVAQSLFHDATPAAQLDLACVWINRYNEPNAAGISLLAELDGLVALAEAAEV